MTAAPMTEAALAESGERAPGTPTWRARVSVRVRRRDPRLVFWAAWAALLALTGLWAVGNPMGAAPDEPSHIVKAAALVREGTLGVETRPGVREAQVQRLYAMTHEMPGCYAFRSSEPATCWQGELVDLDRMETAVTTAGNYNPLYYLVVGLPTLLPPSLDTLYLMRLAGAAFASLLLALGLRSVAEMPVNRWVVGGTAVAITPMVVFMNSSVNPNAVEASAGLGLWLTLLAALRHPDPALVRRRWWRAGFLVVVLVNAKALSPLFLALIVLTVVALAPWRNVTGALGDRRAWPGLGLGVVGSAFAVWWTLTSGGVAGADTVSFPELTPPTALNTVLRLTTAYYHGLIGRFGWLDTRPPDLVYSWVTAVLGLLLILALAAARRRDRWVLVALVVVVVATPVVLQIPQAPFVGLPWQGRYLQAVAVGVPIVAGLLCDRWLADLRPRLARDVVRLVVGATVVVQVVSFAANLRRYVAGTEAPWFDPVDNPWLPPVPASLLLVGSLLAAAAVGAVLVWLAGGAPRAVDADGPGPELSPVRAAAAPAGSSRNRT
ncbi:DUF2142 domain-containing protein [Actinotalea sp. JY-7885]|uniref:DUF2142 domain-containing protein n=1 Tax=Actinotalea sp. JY-7885 TaxID=2758576 RepID=UPI00165D8FBA|nr:DUF2142 domain-containing protein [Actinotalea sp. JY-7885]